MSLLLPVFKQLNMLKWQITDNSVPDIFTGGGFHKNVVLGDINRQYLLNWFLSATVVFAVKLNREVDSWKWDQIRNAYVVAYLQDRAQTV